MDDPSRFTSINEYYTFIYAISYMMFVELGIWIYNFKGCLLYTSRCRAWKKHANRNLPTRRPCGFTGNFMPRSPQAPGRDVYKRQVELCEYFIKTYTRPGELVADICAGSGTTAVAALNAGRRFVCFETAPAFYAAASERIRVARSAVEAGEKGV